MISKPGVVFFLKNTTLLIFGRPREPRSDRNSGRKMTKPLKHFLFILPVVCAMLAILSGCTAPKELAIQQSIISAQSRELDSLRTIEHELWTQIGILRDSLQFYDDIDSGRYYRQLRTLNDEIERLTYQLAVSLDGGRTVSVLAVDDIFEPASAELKESGTRQLDELALKLAETYKNRVFRIEGHSDNVPVGPNLREKFPSNWELSAARASAVVRYLIDNHEIEPERLHLVSYGMSKPIASNSTSEGRRQNRRIRVAVLPEFEEKQQ